MSLPVGTIAAVFALILIQGCTGNDDSPTSQQPATGDGLTPSEALIATTLNEMATAETQFSKTKDSASILRFYTQDYAGIRDGKSEKAQDTEKYLAELLERMHLGEPIGISSKVMNVKPSVTGKLGWATYEYEYKVGSGGVLQLSSQ